MIHWSWAITFCILAFNAGWILSRLALRVNKELEAKAAREKELRK